MAKPVLKVKKEVAKKVWLVITLCILLMIGLTVYREVRMSHYIKTDAVIVNASIKVSSGSRHKRTGRSHRHYATYQFDVDGLQYTAEERVIFSAQKKIGEVREIRYNPQNPQQIDNGTQRIDSILFIVLILFMDILLFWGILKGQDVSTVSQAQGKSSQEFRDCFEPADSQDPSR